MSIIRLGRIVRAIHDLGDLLKAHILKYPQTQRRSLPLRKFLDLFGNNALDFLELQIFYRLRFNSDGHIIDVDFLVRVAPQFVFARVDGYPKQPTLKTAPFFEHVQFLERFYKTVLHDILSRSRVSGKPEGQAIYGLLMALDKFRKSCLVTEFDFSD